MVKKVLVVSESAFRRTLISEMLASHERIEIVGNARNSEETTLLIKNKNPNVLILDIEFKNKEWFEPFNYIMKDFKIGTIILTDIDPKIHDMSILKSHDYIIKPKGIWKVEIPKIKNILISKILLIDVPILHKLDSKIRLNNKNAFIRRSQTLGNKDDLKSSPKEVIEPKIEIPTEPRLEEYFFDLAPITLTRTDTKIIVIGASVGGPRTLRTILSEVPRNFPAPILVVQHLNHLFMRQLVTSLRNICKINVKIGMNHEEIQPGIIYFSPGDKHMQVTIRNKKPCIRTFEGEPVNFCRPSVDVLFYSTARVYKQKTLGILLTGMGKDGVAGLRSIKLEGGQTIAESEETSILYGMPKVAAEAGVANLIIPNYSIAEEMTKFVS